MCWRAVWPGGAVRVASWCVSACWVWRWGPQVRDKAADPPGLRDSSLKLFEEWVQLLNMHADDKGLLGFLTSAGRASGLLKLDDTTDRFLRTTTGGQRRTARPGLGGDERTTGRQRQQLREAW
jgi:hypothetical protein